MKNLRSTKTLVWRPIADIEQGHISTARWLLANVGMGVGGPLVYDPKEKIVTGEEEATKLLARRYRAPRKRLGIA